MGRSRSTAAASWATRGGCPAGGQHHYLQAAKPGPWRDLGGKAHCGGDAPVELQGSSSSSSSRVWLLGLRERQEHVAVLQ